MKKIMFNDKYGLTLAVLEGRKTMTRRAICPKVLEKCCKHERWLLGQRYVCGVVKDSRKYLIGLSPYKVGEVVAIAENYHDVYEELKRTHGSSSRVTREFFHKYVQGGRMPVSNKMFVAADLMPHHIKITDIKVERLQDISDEDCLREGIMEGEFMNTWDRYYFDSWGDVPNHITFKTPRKAFAALIDKVSGKGTWQKNPWVFAYSFERVD